MKKRAIVEFELLSLEPNFESLMEEQLGLLNGFVKEWVKPEKCPYGAIRSLYNNIFKDQSVTQISAKGLKSGSQRAKKLKDRWEDYPDLNWWAELFNYMKESPFLMGKVPPKDGFRQFRLNIDYVINETNLNNIYEGKYHEH